MKCEAHWQAYIIGLDFMEKNTRDIFQEVTTRERTPKCQKKQEMVGSKLKANKLEIQQRAYFC